MVLVEKFSNSLIIHQVKTNKIKEAWIPGLNLHRFLHFRLLLSFCFDSEDISNARDRVSSANPNTSNFVKNTPLRVVFSTLSSVFGFSNETLSLVFDVLLPYLRAPMCYSLCFSMVMA